MKNLFLILTLISSLTVASNAEVFTKDYQKINYTLTADKPVKFELKFKSPKDSCRVTFTVHNEDDVLLIKDSHDMKKANELFNLPVKSGEYSFEMFTHIGCTNKAFEFEHTKVSGEFEKEPNDTTSKATLISEAKACYGYLQKRTNGTKGKDFDYYKINVSEKGTLKLDFKHENFDNNEYFYLELLNDENKKLLNTSSMLNTKGISKSIGLDKGEYFVKVSTYPASTKVRGKEYRLSYTFTKTDNK